MLILAFDTATEIATSALVADGEILGERISRAVALGMSNAPDFTSA